MASSPANQLTRLASPASTRAGAARSATADYFGLDYSLGERTRGRGSASASIACANGGGSKKRRRVRHSLTDDGGHARQRLRELLSRLEPFKVVTAFTQEWAKTPASDDDVNTPKRAKPALRRTPSNIRRRQRRARIAMNKQNLELRATPIPPSYNSNMNFTPDKAMQKRVGTNEDSPGSSISPASSSGGPAASNHSYFNDEDP